MARRVLIVEDNEGVASLLAELCGERGLHVSCVKGGAEALGSLQQALPDLLLLDLVLADLDGFQVANAARALPGGDRLAIVVVSGVYKKLPEAFVARVAPRFLPKPFDPQQVRDVLDEVVGGLDLAAGIQRGRLVRQTPGQLFAELCEKRASGLLEVSNAEVRRRLWWQAGQVRYAQSNVRSESAGGMQVAQGLLDEAAFERAVAHAKSARMPLHEALAHVGALTPVQVSEALRTQTNEVALQVLLSMTGAEWTLTQADPEKVPDARRHVMTLLVDASRRAATPESAKAALLARPDTRVTKSPLLDRELFALRAAAPGESVSGLAASGPTLHELTQRVRPEDLPVLRGLVGAGLVVTEAPAQASHAETAMAAVADDEDRGRRFTPQEEKARRYILAEHERARPLDAYELLGVAPNAPVDECRRAYLELARKYHSDAYSGLELGNARRALAELFQQLNEAVETVTDEKRRSEYAVFLDRKAKGLPTDVTAILRAEQVFQRGELLLKANKAQEALDCFREAVQLNHAEPEFHAYLGYALFRAQGAAAAEEAKGHVQAALKEAPNLASAYVFLGLMARDGGRVDEAIGQLQKALALEPKHDLATRELRALRMKKDRESGKGGLLGKLFGR